MVSRGVYRKYPASHFMMNYDHQGHVYAILLAFWINFQE